MELQLEDRRVVVLGAGAGLGRACALEFAREGAAVTLFGRKPGPLEEVASEVKARGGLPPEVVPGDLSKVEDISRVMHVAAQASGRIDVLFNNGGGPLAGTFEDFDDEAWQDAFTSTLLGYVRAIRAALPFMRAKGGYIMNNTSSSTKSALEGLLLSNVFRLGVAGLTQSLASELASDNIYVNAVAAGRVWTERVQMLDAVRAERAGTTPAEVRRRAEHSIPVARYGRPEEFAKVVVFHCSSANTYVTGQTLLVDGGMYRGY